MSEEKASAGLPSGRFAGREDFRRMVRDALAAAAREGWREIILADATFEEWPLGERAVVESLQAWSNGGRRCILLAKRYDEVVRRHPRFVRWRVTWGHIVEPVAVSAADPQDFPSMFWSPGWVMERRDLDNFVGHSGSEPERRVLARELLNEWLRKASPSFPATTLGL